MSAPEIIRPTPRRPNKLVPFRSTPQYDVPTRSSSTINLTSSTLRGICFPNNYEPEQDCSIFDKDSNSHVCARDTTFHIPNERNCSPGLVKTTRSVSVGLRILFLFGIGVGYGLIIQHIHNETHSKPLQAGCLIQSGTNWKYLTFWGISSLGLGSLLPLVDRVFFENGSAPLKTIHGQDFKQNEYTKNETKSVLDQGWTPIVRSIGTFFGIAFAIRKSPWSSTLQASIALFLADPILWYLIDRSRPGLLLSLAVGAIGTALYIISNSVIMLPSVPSNIARADDMIQNYTTIIPGKLTIGWDMKDSLDTAIWVLSVLFCSCICFGNIGRRLAPKEN
ncbi:INSIG domain-containing protein [Blumeria hordei DH14]|uniref:INSIG domain-containing protein n=1 Tax=Blumeria graminis f. sp. hordei (strain DH14) TaxID=546991 RepID=N1JAD4_BLUG1|nr:INSIG domain-containing protein [Blumeria hordei DH14]